MIVALLKANYGYSNAVILQMTEDEIESDLSQIPALELRRAYPVAQLAAVVLNAMGGKNPNSAPVDPAKVFSPLEFLPWYARPRDLEATPKDARLKPIEGLDPITARGIQEAGPRGYYADNCLWLEVVPHWYGIVATAEAEAS